MVVLEHVGRLQVFMIDGVVGAQQGKRGLVVEILPLPPDLLMLLGEELDRFAAAFAPLLPARYPALGFLQLALGFAVLARILNACPVRQRGKGFQAEVYPRLLARWRQRF